MIYSSILHVTANLPTKMVNNLAKPNSMSLGYPSVWIENKVKISNQVLLTKAFIKYHINIFCREPVEVMEKLTDNQHVLFILRLHFSNGSIRTLNKMVKLTGGKTGNDLKFLLDLLNDKVQTSQDGYKTTPLNAITFAYAIVDGKISPGLGYPSHSIYNSNVKLHTIFNRYKLPISLEVLDYGRLIYKHDNVYIMKMNKTNTAIIKVEDSGDTPGNRVNHVSINRDGLEQITYKDIKIDTGYARTFIRQLNSVEYRYHNRELVLSTKKVRTKFMERIAVIDRDTDANNNFLTLDSGKPRN